MELAISSATIMQFEEMLNLFDYNLFTTVTQFMKVIWNKCPVWQNFLVNWMKLEDDTPLLSLGFA